MELSRKDAITPDTGTTTAHVAGDLADVAAHATASLDETNEQVIKGNEHSSDAYFADVKDSREVWSKIALDPNQPEEARKEARDNLAKLDENTREHDKDNKGLLGELAKNKAGLISTVAVATLSCAVVIATNGKVKIPIIPLKK
ncbi:hypothetical protein [Corynebacterium glutamicum]|uniref:hypothetical protein n=1 Tax=Corynebacterium glutamicum TaxID=1718 RepID=UPI0014689D43|nr:hypothetical protein [Corynebacterium glutamicum]GFK17722.1 hypothetical protein KbCgl_02940 [Corynebacterium glutamicum]